jgi:hypothetical protein
VCWIIEPPISAPTHSVTFPFALAKGIKVGHCISDSLRCQEEVGRLVEFEGTNLKIQVTNKSQKSNKTSRSVIPGPMSGANSNPGIHAVLFSGFQQEFTLMKIRAGMTEYL